MSYNDPTDIEAVLEVPPTPPALIPAGVAAPAAQAALQSQPLPPSSTPSPDPHNVTGLSLPVQTPRAPTGASAQLVPVEPPPTVIAPTTQTPLSVDGQDSTPQTPQATQPGTLSQS